MRSRIIAVLLLVAMAGGYAGEAGPEAEVRSALDAFYQDKGEPPGYQNRIAVLEGDDPAAAQAAAIWLVELLRQADADVASGRSPRRALPYWGGGVEVASRMLGDKVQEAILTVDSASAVPVLVWMVDGARMPAQQIAAISALGRIAGAEADAALLAALARGHSNGRALAVMVEACGTRGLRTAVPGLRALRGHHRAQVRAAAAVALAILGQEAGAETVPAMPQVVRDLATSLLRMLDRIPGPTDVPIMVRWPAEDGRPARELPGWRIDPAGVRPDEIALGTWGGWPEVAPADAEHVWILGWTGVPQRIALVAAERLPAATIADIGQAELLKRLAAGRLDKEHGLSRNGGLTGQFESGAISMPEILVAAQAMRAGDETVVAAVLLPAIEAAADDRHPVWVARDLIGADLHQRLLNAWCEDRLDAAQLLAERLSQPDFVGYGYHERAKELRGQIADARAKPLNLPTPAEWEVLKPSRTRPEQIAYLLDRLRLLHCRQQGQPGGISYDAAADSTRINPFVELRALALAPDELPLLAPHLADPVFLRCYTFWRNFHPGRELHRTRQAVGELINAAARKDLVPARLEPAGVAAAIEAVRVFAATHAGRSAAELRLEAVRSGVDKEQVINAGLEGLAAGQPGIAAALLDRLGQLRGYDQGRAMRQIFAREPALLVARAEELLLRLETVHASWVAAAVLIQGGAGHGQRQRAREVLRAVAADPTSTHAGAMVGWLPTLWPVADQSLRADLRAALTQRELDLTWTGASLVHVLLASSDAASFQIVLAGLDDVAKTGRTSSNGKINRELERRDLWAEAVQRCGGPAYEALTDEATRIATLAASRAWLMTQAEAAAAGKPTAIAPLPRDDER